MPKRPQPGPQRGRTTLSTNSHGPCVSLTNAPTGSAPAGCERTGGTRAVGLGTAAYPGCQSLPPPRPRPSPPATGAGRPRPPLPGPGSRPAGGPGVTSGPGPSAAALTLGATGLCGTARRRGLRRAAGGENRGGQQHRRHRPGSGPDRGRRGPTLRGAGRLTERGSGPRRSPGGSDDGPAAVLTDGPEQVPGCRCPGAGARCRCRSRPPPRQAHVQPGRAAGLGHAAAPAATPRPAAPRHAPLARAPPPARPALLTAPRLRTTPPPLPEGGRRRWLAFLSSWLGGGRSIRGLALSLSPFLPPGARRVAGIRRRATLAPRR